MEESAEAPPAAEEARRFRGSVPTAGRGSGWEPADTTVSAEEHAKKITTQMGGDFWSGRRGSNSLPGIPRMAVAIRGSPASPLDLTRFAQVEAASSPVLRHIPKRIPHPVGWGILFGAGDEESAEAPPAAEEARRFRGSVPTAGRGSGWEPADTTVSAEEHAKKVTTQMGGDLCDCPQVLLSALPHIARKGECEGGTFDGFPYSRSITRPQATTFA